MSAPPPHPAPAQQPEHPDPLRLDRCPECGYSLFGLPVEGRCPECGFAYDGQMVVLYGWATGSRATMANARPATAFAAAAGVVWFVVQGIAVFFAGGRISGMLMIAAAMIIPAVMLYRRWRLLRGGDPPVQVRLFRDGYAQHDGFGKATLHPWNPNLSVRLTPARGGRRVLTISQFTALGRYRMPAVHSVLIELPCDAATADRIQWLIRERCSGVTGTSAPPSAAQR